MIVQAQMVSFYFNTLLVGTVPQFHERTCRLIRSFSVSFSYIHLFLCIQTHAAPYWCASFQIISERCDLQESVQCLACGPFSSGLYVSTDRAACENRQQDCSNRVNPSLWPSVHNSKLICLVPVTAVIQCVAHHFWPLHPGKIDYIYNHLF